jgi:hypothetical protein
MGCMLTRTQGSQGHTGVVSVAANQTGTYAASSAPERLVRGLVLGRQEKVVLESTTGMVHRLWAEQIKCILAATGWHQWQVVWDITDVEGHPAPPTELSVPQVCLPAYTSAGSPWVPEETSWRNISSMGPGQTS